MGIILNKTTMFKTFAAAAIATIASAQECETHNDVEMCFYGDSVMSTCYGDECWWGYYDEEGFLVGDEDMNGMACDWYGDCLGVYDGSLFAISGGEEVHDLSIGIDFIEELVVGSVYAVAGGMCEHNADLSEMYAAEVFDCAYGEEEWTFGLNEEGFAMGTADDDYMMCSWAGDCMMQGPEGEGCTANWEWVEC